MQKKFFANLFLILLLNLVVKPLYIFAIDAEVQNQVGDADYGMYFALLNISFLFNIVLDIGITNFNTRNIAQHPQLLNNYIGPILGLRTILGLAYAVLVLLVGFSLGYSLENLKLLLLLVFNQFLVGLIFYFRSNFAGLHLFKVDALMSVLDRFLLILICGSVLYAGLNQSLIEIEYFILAQTIAYGLTALIGFGITLKYVGIPKLKIKRLFSIAILKKSAPFALLILLMSLYNRIDAVMVERMLTDGKVQAGYYAQGFRLLDAVNMFALLFAGLLLPMFARFIKENKSVKKLVKQSGELLISVAIAIAVTSFFNAEWILGLIYDTPLETSIYCFKILIMSFIPVSVTYIYGTLLTANGSLKKLNWMAFAGLVLNLSLNFILIPNYKAEGAAIATLITQIATAIAQVIIAMKVFEYKYTGFTIGALIIHAVWIISIGMLARSYFDSAQLFCIMLVAALLSTLFLKLFDYKNLKAIFSK